jgi:hypothetical protein
MTPYLIPYPVSLVFSCSSRSLWLSLCAFLGANEGLRDVLALPETRRRGCFGLPASQPGLYWRCKCTKLCHSWYCRSKCTPLPPCFIRRRHSSSSPHLLSIAPRHTHDQAYTRPRAHVQRSATHVLHTDMRVCLHAHERHAYICTSDAADAQAPGDRRLTCPSISSQTARGINAAEHLVPSSTCFTTSIVLSTMRIDTRGYLCVCVIDRHRRRSTRSGLPRVCVCMFKCV